MSRAPVVRALFALALIIGSFFIVLNGSPRLGLDLRGGTQIVLETRDSPTVAASRESTDRALEVLRRRVDALGVAEPSLARSGDRRIIVELPGVQDPREASQVIGRTAQLTFHPVLGAGPAASGGGGSGGSGGERTLPDEDGQPIRLGPAALTGGGVSKAEAGIDTEAGTGWFVTVDFKGSGKQTWEKLTGDAARAAPGDPRRRVAIVLDNRVISSPQVDPGVAPGVGITGGSTQITGRFSQQEADDLAALISGGALPVPVEVIEQRTVGPTLGAAAIDASALAAMIGIGLTALFIIWIYRLVGIAATLALAAYALISYAALIAIGATLTLPGLAGFVLAIGMAVDANVLVFERAREEFQAAPRRGPRRALVAGFGKAVSAVADSNITTLLAAALLFFLASGPVRGFGVTLTIGVLASLVSALVITRVIAEWAVGRRRVRARPLLTGLGAGGRVRAWLDRRDPDVMRHRRVWLAISALAVLAAITGIAVKGLNYGVEFTGGRLIEYSTSRAVPAEAARAAVADAGFPRAVVQTSGDDNISVRTGRLTNDEAVRIEQALTHEGGKVTKQRDELIGPSLGSELRTKGLIAFGVALAVQLGYLAVRFRPTFAASAVAAMCHDVIIVTGVFAWFGRPIDGVFLAAVLTIIGYSVNDTVVVFDRIRERWGMEPRQPFARIANQAALQTVPRTVNTGLGALFILTALAVLGGDSLTDFAVALVLGILVGTWSSVFTATPLAITLEAHTAQPPPRHPGTAVRRAPAHREPGDSGAVV